MMPLHSNRNRSENTCYVWSPESKYQSQKERAKGRRGDWEEIRMNTKSRLNSVLSTIDELQYKDADRLAKDVCTWQSQYTVMTNRWCRPQEKASQICTFWGGIVENVLKCFNKWSNCKGKTPCAFSSRGKCCGWLGLLRDKTVIKPPAQGFGSHRVGFLMLIFLNCHFKDQGSCFI